MYDLFEVSLYILILNLSVSLTVCLLRKRSPEAIRPELKGFLSLHSIGLGCYIRQPTDTASNDTNRRVK